MEDLHIVDNWKDKMLGDLKEFSTKKHKPVGMHHLIQEINKLANPSNILEIGYTAFKNDFIKKTLLEKIEDSENKIISKLPVKISDVLKKENLFTKEVKSVIVYYIPVPKSVFKFSVKDINNHFNLLKQEKKKIDSLILHALSKYGYWGIPEDLNDEFLFKNFDKNKIFKASHLGDIAPNGFPVSFKNGPRMFISYMITNAPLKVQLDKPVDVCNEECLKTAGSTSFEHLKYYRSTFGLKRTVLDIVKSIITDNRFGEYIDFCYNCKLGNEYEINLLVKDPLDYKK